MSSARVRSDQSEIHLLKNLKVSTVSDLQKEREINSLIMRALLFLQHPNIVKYTGFVKTKEFLYIILE